MGGSRSGRGIVSRKPIVERTGAVRAADLTAEWRLHGMPRELTLGMVGHIASCAVSVMATIQPRGGGLRLWLLCPSCGKRRAALYVGQAPVRSNWLRIACRVCMGLRYASQRLSKGWRWRHRAAKLYRRADCDPDDVYHYRPKYMRWARFNALIEEANAWDDAGICWSMRGLAKPNSWLQRAIHARCER